MSENVTIELIRDLPALIGLLIIIFILIGYRRRLGDLLSRLGSVKAFGLEAAFDTAQEQLEQATISYELTPSPRAVRLTIKRANQMRRKLRNSRILWVDDQFLANANIYRFLNAYGVVIDGAKTTEEAMAGLKWAARAYDVVVTDMNRPGDNQAGVTLLNSITQEKIKANVLVLVSKLDKSRGTPAGAIAITDDPNELINLIFNVIDDLY